VLLLFGILPEVTPSRSKRVAMNTVVGPKSIALHVEAERCMVRAVANAHGMRISLCFNAVLKSCEGSSAAKYLSQNEYCKDRQ